MCDFQGHEEKLNEIDMIQSHLLSNDFKSQQDFELLKRSLNRSIQEESEKLVDFSPYEEMISGNLTTIADPWYFGRVLSCTSKAHKPVTLS